MDGTNRQRRCGKPGLALQQEPVVERGVSHGGQRWQLSGQWCLAASRHTATHSPCQGCSRQLGGGLVVGSGHDRYTGAAGQPCDGARGSGVRPWAGLDLCVAGQRSHECHGQTAPGHWARQPGPEQPEPSLRPIPVWQRHQSIGVHLQSGLGRSGHQWHHLGRSHISFWQQHHRCGRQLLGQHAEQRRQFEWRESQRRGGGVFC